MMTEDEIEKKAKRKKNGCTTIGFSINDCPLWLYKWFVDDPSRYNDVYWVRLKELHDILMMQEIMSEQPQQVKEEVSLEDKEKEKKIKDSHLVNTFRGSEEVKISKDFENKTSQTDEKVEGGK